MHISNHILLRLVFKLFRTCKPPHRFRIIHFPAVDVHQNNRISLSVFGATAHVCSFVYIINYVLRRTTIAGYLLKDVYRVAQ